MQMENTFMWAWDETIKWQAIFELHNRNFHRNFWRLPIMESIKAGNK